jgi:hypothetical protein
MLDGVTGRKQKEIDNYSGDYSDILFKQNGYYHQKDWYSVAHIYLSFKINTHSEAICPAYW